MELEVFPGLNLSVEGIVRSKIYSNAALLLDQISDLNFKDDSVNTLLHRAIKSQNILFTKLLLEKGASTEERNKMGSTPLIFAASISHPEICTLLVNNGADIDTFLTPYIIWRHFARNQV